MDDVTLWYNRLNPTKSDFFAISKKIESDDRKNGKIMCVGSSFYLSYHWICEGAFSTKF